MVSLSARSTLTSPTVRSIVDELGAHCLGGRPLGLFPLSDILDFIGLQTVDLTWALVDVLGWGGILSHVRPIR